MAPTPTARPKEEGRLHTRVLKCTLELANSRIFWVESGAEGLMGAEDAFEAGWFGHRSLTRLRELLTHLRARYAAFPAALRVLHRWPGMGGDTQKLICHWHLQLSDPLYRQFSGTVLPDRLLQGQPTVSKQQVVTWLGEAGAGRWAGSTRLQLASKLLTTAHSAGLIQGKRDPRPLVVPLVPDDALTYVLHLLREVDFEGTVLANPYLRSVGLEGSPLNARLKRLPDLRYGRQGDLVDMGWKHPDLAAWADHAGLGGAEQRELAVA
ncbi:MAG: BrxA family protein [Synechococcaceae cyanobacterium]